MQDQTTKIKGSPVSIFLNAMRFCYFMYMPHIIQAEIRFHTTEDKTRRRPD